MKKAVYCSVFLCVFIFILLIHQYTWAAGQAEQSVRGTRPLHIVLLMDSSGSMKKTDPGEIRKLASQAVVSLLSAEDKIAVVQFDSEAKVISKWISASEKSTIINFINQVGYSGNHTDFRAGLDAAMRLFKDSPPDAEKVIFLLSDGVFEPNPHSDVYAPYHIEYRMAIRSKDKEEIRKINDIYRNKLTPVAKRLIDDSILPVLNKEGVEVYCVGLSPDVDRVFLNDLAIKTSKTKTESHYFYANSAVDLMDTFLGLLHFWKNKIVLKSEQGSIMSGLRATIPIDAYLTDVSFILLTENPVGWHARKEGEGKDEPVLDGTHPNLKVATLTQAKPPGTWSYTFNQGSGAYKLLVVGKSTLEMLITGIKEKYTYGEPIKAQATIKINRQDARLYLAPGPRVVAEVSAENVKETLIDLQEGKESFTFEHAPPMPGKLKIKFTLLAKDKQNNDLLPRPSIEFVTEILPRFYVEPEYVKFGDVRRGAKKEIITKVHSGLNETVRITVNSSIKTASRCDAMKEKQPFIANASDFEIRTGQTVEQPLQLVVPQGGCWGDYEGVIIFSSINGNRASVGFHVHVPSLWEKLPWFIMVFIILIGLLLFLFTLYLGYLKSPVGVLRPVSFPPGAILLNDIKLSSIKRGFWHKFLHWKKNVITIGQSGHDLNLGGLPNSMKVELIFHRFGGDYIKNVSPASTDNAFTVCQPDVGIPIERRSGASYRLAHGLNIKINDYEFVFEHIK